MTLKRFAAAALIAVALAGCGDEKKAAAPAAQVSGEQIAFPEGSPQIAALRAVPVRSGEPVIVTLPGRLVWDEDRTARVFAAFAGRVTKILAALGESVKPGQKLALVASPDFGEAQADARKAEADLALAQKNVARLRELAENGVAARKDLQAAEADFGRAQAEAARTTARVKLYGGGGAVDQNLSITAPVAGVIVERNVNPGQELRPDVAMAGQQAMFVITDPSRLWLQLDATERDLPLLAPGKTVKIRSSAYPDERFVARLDVVSDFIDRETRTVRVRGTIDNADRRLKGEMFVTAELETPPAKGFAVPAKAVFFIGDRYFVFLEDGPGRYTRREVQAGPERGGKVPVSAGLKDGDRVVVDGSLFLQQIYAAAKR
ncbi:MAG: efflux RND transporter periplasmic adaptor subunit [Burkholderiales bacterium]|jgi:cobalt-zinc-cadmium efflux system membrane fusion protein|nr:efflux RND transporter periplasmic adaptor subunit [Burkholderiales bacterium]